MADAEIRFRAVLQDDASRGIDSLDSKVQESGQKAVNANKAIGASASRAATDSGTAATRIGRAYQAVESGAKRAASAIASSSAPLGRFADGFKSASAAASSFSGKMGTLGGSARKAVDGVKSAFRSMGGAVSSAARAGAEIGGKIKDGITRRVAEAKEAVGQQLKDLGKNAALAVGIAAGAVAVGAIKDAAALEQSMGAIQAVFKDTSAQMYTFAQDAATTVGLSRNEYQEFATVIGSLMKNAGVPMEELGSKTNDLIGLGGDLASMFGTTTTEAMQALTGALKGEFDMLDNFGISMNAATIEAEALALGHEKVGGAFSEEAKQAAALSLVYKQTKDVQGNFARETGTLSGATQILKAEWTNFTTELASYVVPILATLVVWLSDRVMPALEGLMNGWGAFIAHIKGGDAADWGVLQGFDLVMANVGTALHDAGRAAADMWSDIRPFFDFVVRHKDVFGALAIGIGFAAIAMGTLTAATWFLNAALAVAFSPVVLVGAFIAGLILAYNKIGWFKDGVDALWNWFLMVTKVKIDLAVAVIRGIVAAFRWTVDAIRNAWEGVTAFFSTVWDAIKASVQTAAQFIQDAWANIRSAVGAVVEWVTGTARTAWESATQAIGSVMQWLYDTIIKPVWDSIRFQIAIVVGIILTLWDGVKWAIEKTLGPAFRWLNDSVIQPVWKAIQDAIRAVADWWTGTAVPAIQGAVSAVSDTWNAFKTLVSTVWNAIRSSIESAWNFVRNSVLQPAIDFIRGAVTDAWDHIRNRVTEVWTNIRSRASEAWNFLRTNVFQPVISFIRGAVTDAWDHIRNRVTEVWTNIRSRASEAWNFLRNNVFNPVIDFLRVPLTNAWNFVRDAVTNVWNNIRDRSSNAWSAIRDNVLEPFRRFIRDTIPNAFTGARDAIGRAWDGIKKKVIDPINEVIRVIKDTLIGNINNVLREFGMPTINIGFTSVGGSFRDGGYTGPGHPGAPAGVVHRDEQVIRSPARRSIEDVFPGLLDDMNKRGAAAIGAAAPGATVYGGARSFTGGLTQQVFNAGRLNVSGSAPGYDLAGAIRMLDNATRVKVAAGGGSPNVNVSAGNYADWWAGYFSGNSVRLNNRVAGAMNPAAKRVLVAHELGHALGLPHSDPSGLKSMMSYANMYQHNSVTSADVAALSAIYGGTGFASGGGGIDFIGLLMKGIDAAINAIMSVYNTPAGRMAVGAGRFMIGKAKDWITGKVGGANRGFVLPGYTPGTDQTPLMASRGEAVLVPQLVKALGAGNVQAANITATGSRAGGPEAAVNMLTARRRGESGGGVTIQVNLDVTIEGNADMDAIKKLEDELEPMLYRIIESNARRGY